MKEVWTAKRAVRGIAVGWKNRTFCGSDSGRRLAAAIYTRIETCKLNDIEPRAEPGSSDHSCPQIAHRRFISARGRRPA